MIYNKNTKRFHLFYIDQFYDSRSRLGKYSCSWGRLIQPSIQSKKSLKSKSETDRLISGATDDPINIISTKDLHNQPEQLTEEAFKEKEN